MLVWVKTATWSSLPKIRLSPVFFFGFLLILFLPSQLGLHFWPDWTVISGIKIPYLSPTLLFIDLHSIFFIYFSKPRLNYKLLFLPALNILLSQNLWLTLVIWIKVFIYYLVYLGLKKYTRYNKYWYLALYLSVFWVSVLAILQFAVGKNIGGIWYWLGERPLSLATPYISKVYLENLGYFLRPYSTFPHPNALAGYLLISLILLIKNKINIFASLRLCIFVSGFTALLLTFSKTILFPLAIFMSPSDLHISVNERLLLFQNSISVIQKYPLTGIGLGTYPAVSYTMFPSSLPLSYQPVHNIFMLILSELGLPIFIAVLILLFNNFKHSFQILNFKFQIAAFLITGMLDHYWLTSPSNLLLLFVVAALLQSTNARQSNHFH